MKGIFITYGCPSVYDKSGIGLKIRNQIEAFKENDLDFSELTLDYDKSIFLRVLYRLPFYNGYPIWKYDERMQNVDCIYLRRPFVMSVYMRNVLKRIRINNPKVKIVLELPTYPYDPEIAHFKLSWPILLKDRYNRNRLKGIVDRIATLSKDDMLFDIPTIKITNGINVENTCVRRPKNTSNKEIHLCAIGLFKEWHGYERLLYGMSNYYKAHGDRKVFLHFIGEGQEIPLYKSIVEKNRLGEYVIFHGYLTGQSLDNVYDDIDIGVCSLGGHRKGSKLTSELKSREYLAKGLPVISSLPIDIFETFDFPYCLYVPSNETAISIESIVEFFDRIYRSKNTETIINKIRQYALDNIDMKITMKPVIEYFKKDSYK